MAYCNIIYGISVSVQLDEHSIYIYLKYIHNNTSSFFHFNVSRNIHKTAIQIYANVTSDSNQICLVVIAVGD